MGFRQEAQRLWEQEPQREKERKARELLMQKVGWFETQINVSHRIQHLIAVLWSSSCEGAVR